LLTLRFELAESGVDWTETIGVRELDKEDGVLGTIFELTIQLLQPYILDDSGPPRVNIFCGRPPSITRGVIVMGCW
jgi:hypothetical protein